MPRDAVSRTANVGTVGANGLVDSALRALSTLRGLRGAPEVPPLCRETQSFGQHMLELSCENATVGTNGLNQSCNIISYNLTLSINCIRKKKD